LRLKDISPVSVYHCWLKNCDCFECFLRATPFASLKHYHDFEIKELDKNRDKKQEDIYAKIITAIKAFDLGNTLLILDLPGEVSIMQGFNLNNLNYIKPVPVFNFLLHDYGLVGNESFVNKLVECGLKLQDIKTKGYVFLLDYDRYGDFTEEEYKKGFNNQYELFDENLPSTEFLIELGLNKIVYIAKEQVKEDINQYFEYIKSEGIEVLEIFLNEVNKYEQ
jgi:hypothetical protein